MASLSKLVETVKSGQGAPLVGGIRLAMLFGYHVLFSLDYCFGSYKVGERPSCGTLLYCIDSLLVHTLEK